MKIKTLFWYELIRRARTHVALDRPRIVGERISLKDSVGYVIQQNPGDTWTAYTGAGNVIGNPRTLDEAKGMVQLRTSGRIFVDLSGGDH